MLYYTQKALRDKYLLLHEVINAILDKERIGMNPQKVWLFSDLLEKNKRVFKVPVYQRNYSWSNVQCEKLYQDILDANRRNHKHFIGTIVYIADFDSSNLSEVLIIDGQQRLTTMYILLKALYDVARNVSVRIESEIQEVIFNRHCDEKYKLKLKPIKIDNEQLLLLMKNEIDEMDRNSNIYKNYITFKGSIEKTLSSGLELSDILNGIKKLEMVEIVLDIYQGDEPQKIFESINSTGLDLSLSDLIRNYLLMDDIDQDELYEDYWSCIERNVGYRNLGDFVINYLNSHIAGSVNAKNAYRLFKEHFESKNLTHKDILKDLLRTSKCYGAFIGEKRYYSEEITELLHSFYVIKQTTVLPFIFKIFNDYEEAHIDEKTLCDVLSYMLTYFVRITSCELNRNLSKFMKSLYDRIYDSNYENYYERFVIFINDLRTNDRMPTDAEFKDALIHKPLYKKPICKYILSVIENSTNEQIDFENLTIEHILPQKINAAVWRKELGDDYEKVYSSYLHTLGNLTISGDNSELGTKPFEEKKKIIRVKSKANILNKDVLSAKQWNEKAIKKRANALADILLEKFNYVEKHSDIYEANELSFGLNSDIDLSYTKPGGFSFMGEYTAVSSWVDLLSKFIDIVYDLDSELINELAIKNYTISNADRVYISNDTRKLRKGKQIGKTEIFFESNLSSNNIISFVRDLLSKMDYDSAADEFSFSLSEAPFDIENENTWSEGMIPVAKLFYNLIDDLIKRDQIDIDEIEKLKTKSYTKSIFKATDYPAIAENIDDNRGNSVHKRYRAKELSFNNENIYISTQFFDSDREAVIEWYKAHLKNND